MLVCMRMLQFCWAWRQCQLPSVLQWASCNTGIRNFIITGFKNYLLHIQWKACYHQWQGELQLSMERGRSEVLVPAENTLTMLDFTVTQCSHSQHTVSAHGLDHRVSSSHCRHHKCRQIDLETINIQCIELPKKRLFYVPLSMLADSDSRWG